MLITAYQQLAFQSQLLIRTVMCRRRSKESFRHLEPLPTRTKLTRKIAYIPLHVYQFRQVPIVNVPLIHYDIIALSILNTPTTRLAPFRRSIPSTGRKRVRLLGIGLVLALKQFQTFLSSYSTLWP